MRTISRKIVVLSLFLILAGCANGVLFNSGLYSHTVQPLTINPNPTEVRDSMKQARGYTNQFQYQVVSIRVGKTASAKLQKSTGSRQSILPILKDGARSSVCGKCQLCESTAGNFCRLSKKKPSGCEPRGFSYSASASATTSIFRG